MLLTIHFASPYLLHGQPGDFGWCYREVNMPPISTDKQESIHLMDSLLAGTRGQIERIAYSMLLGEAHYLQGDPTSAFIHLLNAQRLATETRDPAWQTRTSLMLTSYFRMAGLHRESSKQLQLAASVIERQRKNTEYFFSKAALQQEKSYRAFKDSAFYQAIDNLKEGQYYLKSITPNQEAAILLSAENDWLYALSYLHINQLEKTDSLLKTSLSKFRDKNNKKLPHIYWAKAELAIKKQAYDSAYTYLQIARSHLKKPAFREIDELLSTTFYRYYQAIKNEAEGVRYIALHREIVQQRGINARSLSNELIQNLHQDREQQQRLLNQMIVLFLLTFIVLSIIVLRSWRQKKKEKERYMQVVEQLARESANSATVESQKPVKKKSKRALQISEGTELRLLEELKVMEAQGDLLDKEVSLSSIAMKLNTNQRYISQVIQQHRDKDFKTYLQHYRIHYIMNRIHKEPNLLKYKLSYLADMAGFSSHSKFSTAFKEVNGISPSVFIQYTQKERAKEHSCTIVD